MTKGSRISLLAVVVLMLLSLVGGCTTSQHSSGFICSFGSDADERGGPGQSPVAFSGDGTFVASVLSDNVVVVWSVADHAEALRLRGHEGTIVALEFSPENSQLFSIDNDNQVIAWAIPAGEMLRRVQGPRPSMFGGVNRTVLGPDGSMFATAHYSFGTEEGPLSVAESCVSVWDPLTGEAIHELKSGEAMIMWPIDPNMFANSVEDVAFYPTGDLLAVADNDGVALWNLVTGNTSSISSQRACAVAISGDGRLLATGDFAGTVLVWEIPTARLVYTLRGHDDEVEVLAFSPDSSLLASGAFDKNAFLWDMSTGRQVARLAGHQEIRTDGKLYKGVWGIAFSPDGSLLATSGSDERVTLWDLSQLF